MTAKIKDFLPAGIITLFFLFLSIKANGADPLFHLPIQCLIGQDCYIQNFFDHDPRPRAQDYSCGHLTYDGHQGTDFSLFSLKGMADGVNVLAAAPGTVVAKRDGEPDISVLVRGQAALAGKDAGNSVRIRHSGDWETQYSHMKKGSLTVHVGQKVNTGTILGQVGLSGNTEFPHLHFSVRLHGHDIDPFAPTPQRCGFKQLSLWSPDVQDVLQYQPTGMLNAGFSPEIPQRVKVDNGAYTMDTISSIAPALVFWIVLFGAQQDDLIELRLYDPEDKILHAEQRQALKNQAMLFAFTGKRRATSTWTPGTYTGQIILTRNGNTVIDTSRTITVQEERGSHNGATENGQEKGSSH